MYHYIGTLCIMFALSLKQIMKIGMTAHIEAEHVAVNGFRAKLPGSKRIVGSD